MCARRIDHFGCTLPDTGQVIFFMGQDNSGNFPNDVNIFTPEWQPGSAVNAFQVRSLFLCPSPFCLDPFRIVRLLQTPPTGTLTVRQIPTDNFHPIPRYYATAGCFTGDVVLIHGGLTIANDVEYDIWSPIRSRRCSD